MMKDPRKACANRKQRLGWALVHDGIAHPLMALTLFAKWALRFHDYTSHRAWPRKRSAFTGLCMQTTSATECEWYRESMRKAGLPCWSQSMPLPDGTIVYQYGTFAL